MMRLLMIQTEMEILVMGVIFRDLQRCRSKSNMTYKCCNMIQIETEILMMTDGNNGDGAFETVNTGICSSQCKRDATVTENINSKL